MIELLKIKSFKFNLSWLVFDKIFRASLNIIVTIIIARNLGPENFGVLSYLLVLVFLFTTISTLGMNPVLTNNIIKFKKYDTNSIIITCYLVRFLFSIISYIIFILFILQSSNSIVFLDYSIIIGLVIVFKSSEILFSYFEAKLQSKFIVISQLIGTILLIITLYIIFLNKLNNIYIYFAFLIEAVSIFIIINFIFFKKINYKFILRKNIKVIYKIFSDSLPVLISTMCIILYMRIDQIMINKILGQYELGLYSVSVRLIEIFHFIPKILMISYLPILLKNKNYNQRLIILNSYISKFSIILIFLILFSSDFFTRYLFGYEYVESIYTTNVLSFSLIFVYFGVVNEHWYIAKKLQKYYAFYVFLGALLNIFLNIYLIPIYGILGAAYATIITYIFLIFIFDMVAIKTRKILSIKLRSIIKL